MDSYVQQLEAQNEELKQKLAVSQAIVLDNRITMEQLTPRWSADNGSLFQYGAYMSLIATVTFNDKSGKWFVKFAKRSTDWDDTNAGPYDECYDAQQDVEKRYNSLVGMRSCMMKILKREKEDE